ncbi:MAG: 50S ribosomal protein L10 [Candidatus Kapaibacteriales bacterium]
MITLQQKQEVVSSLVEKIKSADGVYLVDFGGMSVAKTVEFRNELREEGISMTVAKNTLIKRALAEVEGFEGIIPDDVFAGPSALILGKENPVAPAKLIKKHFEKGEQPKLKAAVIEGQFYAGSELKRVASLPTREDMIAGMMGSLMSPASGIAGSLGAVIRDLASVIEEVAKKKEAA